MEQVPVPASFIQPAFILLDGRVIPMDFPYLPVLMQGRNVYGAPHVLFTRREPA